MSTTNEVPAHLRGLVTSVTDQGAMICGHGRQVGICAECGPKAEFLLNVANEEQRAKLVGGQPHDDDCPAKMGGLCLCTWHVGHGVHYGDCPKPGERAAEKGNKTSAPPVKWLGLRTKYFGHNHECEEHGVPLEVWCPRCREEAVRNKEGWTQVEWTQEPNSLAGLSTLRERRARIATAVLAGFAAKKHGLPSRVAVTSAVMWADALIVELDK